jgi:hypothetical protein
MVVREERSTVVSRKFAERLTSAVVRWSLGAFMEVDRGGARIRLYILPGTSRQLQQEKSRQHPFPFCKNIHCCFFEELSYRVAL